nr:hypothetical protein GCM10020093_009920 [Planobispora longispora]
MLPVPDHASRQRRLPDGRPAGGRAGRDSNSVGVYICTDLSCSLYVRGKKLPELGGRLQETLTVEQQIDRTRARLSAFLDKVMA